MKTVKQLAQELGVTEQTIRNELKRQNLLQNLTKSKTAILIDENAENIIKSARDNREKTKDFAKVEQKQSDILVILEKQLAEKDKQIAELQKQVSELTSMLKAEQLLHARSQQRIEQHDSRKWWHRFLKKESEPTKNI